MLLSTINILAQNNLEQVRTLIEALACWSLPHVICRTSYFHYISCLIFQYESGEGTQYLSRAQAMKKLQLNLKDFRKLCILKGIYPREPKIRKRAQKGRGGIQTLYHKKDIQFLLHEPIIWKIRDTKVRNSGLYISYRRFVLMNCH